MALRDFWLNIAILGHQRPSPGPSTTHSTPENRRKQGLLRDNKLGANLTGGEWWARQDSNLQPDRYERPALTS